MKKLLVVDDEFIVRVGIRSMMNWEEYGYTVVDDASSGEEALEKISIHHPDIVLADLKMENMDGFELIRRCRKEFPQTAFIVLSSHNDFEDVRKAMKMGAKDYLFKPTLNRDELLRVIREVSGQEESPHDDLNIVIRENLQAIRFNLLRKWVKQSGRDEDILAQFRTLAPKVDPEKPFVILYVSIDEYEKQYLHGDTHFLKSSMENTINQIINREEAEVFNYEKGDMAVFINLSKEKGDRENQSSPEELFYKIQEYCGRYLGLDVSGTISPAAGIESVPELIRVCADTLAQGSGKAELRPYNHGQRNEIARAREYIARHLGERFGLPEIAAAAGMSESYFSHLFKKETGHNITDYITRLKMEYAAGILENSRIKIADVAEQIGLDNPNYFSVIFKKAMGLSPHEYREKMISGKHAQGGEV